MSLVYIFLLLLTQFSLSTCDDLSSFYNSNCTLSFQVRTIYQSNKIQTDFPLQFLANYNLTCNISNLTAYYKITPLAILVVGQYKNEDVNIKSMVELNSTQFRFKINQSSTIRLCTISADDDDDTDDNDNDHRICRQIHIGINTLYGFWNVSMKTFYICCVCLIEIYYISHFLRGKWRKAGRKLRPKLSEMNRFPCNEKKNDTFEDEKVHRDVISDGEEEK